MYDIFERPWDERRQIFAAVEAAYLVRGVPLRSRTAPSGKNSAPAMISELITDARSAHGAIALVADLDWPPHAVTMRALAADGREVHSEIKGDARG
jgi:hypothetical protein